MPASSASSSDSCSLACTVAISPIAWPSWLPATLLVSIRNSLGCAASPWLYSSSASSGLSARALTPARSAVSWLRLLMMPLIALASAGVSVLTVAAEVMAEVKAGSFWSVLVMAVS